MGAAHPANAGTTAPRGFAHALRLAGSGWQTGRVDTDGRDAAPARLVLKLADEADGTTAVGER